MENPIIVMRFPEKQPITITTVPITAISQVSPVVFQHDCVCLCNSTSIRLNVENNWNRLNVAGCMTLNGIVIYYN